MSKTLFWYVFRDLLKVFLLTSGVLAGILSFGGLLKPLTQYGLSGTQVAQMLAFFMPAAQTYSLPIAALFATTVVYGRLSADNELVACRASGISLLTMAVPAFVMGLMLALVSIVCLNYIVPASTLRVEKVAFESLADVVKKNIDRNHQLKLQGFTIYAESASIEPPDPARPDVEVVLLDTPMFCRYQKEEVQRSGQPGQKTEERISRPSEFFMARTARVLIRNLGDHVEFTAMLNNGTTFPRDFTGGSMGGVGTSGIGPIPLDSPIKENTKFMNLRQLKDLYKDPSRSREVTHLFTSITRAEQEAVYLNALSRDLSRDHTATLSGDDPTTGRKQTYTLTLEERRPEVRSSHQKLIAYSTRQPREGEQADHRIVRLVRQEEQGQGVVTDAARQITIRAESGGEEGKLKLEMTLEDVITEGPVRSAKRDLIHYLSVRMPEEVSKIATRTPAYYAEKKDIKVRSEDNREDVRKLQRRLTGLRNGIEAQIHSRGSFAVSCLILVMIGCALGMMFRTGNYLSAFSLSVMPALLTIALITTGQHVAENDTVNSLYLGLALIWLGNVIVAILAFALLTRLRRQ
jgi:lipopolysaccharide export LptBFGC system permease protein LptF